MTIDGPTHELPRDRYGRPMVVPPEGGKAKAYTRCTTFVDCLEDKYNLQKWLQRMVAIGLASRPDLLLAVSAADHADKSKLDKICDDAAEAAKANAAATTGTAVHALTEKVDRGEELPVIPEAYIADLDAYRAATAALEKVAIEQFTVCDEYAVGGTPDRVVKYQGHYYIADVKTGSIQWGMGKIATQLAMYSRGVPYHHETGERAPFPFAVDQEWGIIIHLPAGDGECTLHWVDLYAGWEAVQLASQVREWRKRKDLAHLFAAEGTTFTYEDEAHNGAVGSYEIKIREAQTLDEVRALYSEAVASGVDSAAILNDCLARKEELEEAA